MAQSVLKKESATQLINRLSRINADMMHYEHFLEELGLTLVYENYKSRKRKLEELSDMLQLEPEKTLSNLQTLVKKWIGRLVRKKITEAEKSYLRRHLLYV